MSLDFFKKHFNSVTKSLALVTQKLESEQKTAEERQQKIYSKLPKEPYCLPQKQKKKKKKPKKEAKNEEDIFLDSLLQNQFEHFSSLSKSFEDWLQLQKKDGNQDKIYGKQLVRIQQLEKKLNHTNAEKKI